MTTLLYANMIQGGYEFFQDDASRRQAVQIRDPLADGLFIYAVKTTKVYCRPICKARLARRANVKFYQTGKDAQAAGFRACKRCKPELNGLMPEEVAVKKIRAFLTEHGSDGRDTGLSLSQMATKTGLSKWHFHRVFKQCVGVTPVEYLRTQKQTGFPKALCAAECVSYPAIGSHISNYQVSADTTNQFAAETRWPAEDENATEFLDDFLQWLDEEGR